MHRHHDRVWPAPDRYDRQKRGQNSLPQLPGELQLLNTKKGMNIHKQLSLHHKKASTKVSCPPLTPLHGQGHVLPMPWLQNSSPGAIPEQGACTSARLGPKQHKMSWTMPCKTLQKQKRRLQSQLALGTAQKVCRKYLQGSSSSCHKTNLKYNEALVEKFLLKPARYHSGSSCLEMCFFSEWPLMFLPCLQEHKQLSEVLEYFTPSS